MSTLLLSSPDVVWLKSRLWMSACSLLFLLQTTLCIEGLCCRLCVILPSAPVSPPPSRQHWWRTIQQKGGGSWDVSLGVYRTCATWNTVKKFNTLDSCTLGEEITELFLANSVEFEQHRTRNERVGTCCCRGLCFY